MDEKQLPRIPDVKMDTNVIIKNNLLPQIDSREEPNINTNMEEKSK